MTQATAIARSVLAQAAHWHVELCCGSADPQVLAAWLATRTRTIFLLAQIEELSYVEIGKRLGVSLPTVKKHLVRAYTECLVLAAA